MNIKKQIQKELDSAIDNMDMDKINRCLSALSSGSGHIEAENAKAFSARILQLSEKNQRNV